MAKLLLALLVDIRSLCGVEPVMLVRWMTRRLAVRPAHGAGPKGIAGREPGFAVAAPRTFECAMLEAAGAGGDVGRYHPHLAVRAARTVDRQKLWIGSRHPRHDLKK
jgi:hypothetical protein